MFGALKLQLHIQCPHFLMACTICQENVWRYLTCINAIDVHHQQQKQNPLTYTHNNKKYDCPHLTFVDSDSHFNFASRFRLCYFCLYKLYIDTFKIICSWSTNVYFCCILNSYIFNVNVTARLYTLLVRRIKSIYYWSIKF